MRPNSVDGNSGSLEAIKGEELIFPSTDPQANTYRMIGSASVNGRLVSFWASTDPANPSYIQVDAQVVAQSPNIPYTWDRPLQLAVVEEASAGIVYPADHQSIPLYWDINAMEQALADGNGLYFDNYTTDVNSVLLSAPPEFPIQDPDDPLPNVGEGLPVGQYQYRLRYVTPNGDRTNLGPETPLIAVPRVQDYAQNNRFPGGRTTGGPADATIASAYGIKLKFRIDNIQGYSSLEIVRRRFNDGQGLNGPGIDEVVSRIDINPGQFGIFTFTDPVDAFDLPEVIPQDEAEQRLISFTAPKGVEYADSRLSYANFRVESRIADLEFEEVDGNRMIPITKRMTTLQADGSEINSGYSDPINNTYYKKFMGGERYGIGILPWDGYSSKAPVVSVVDDYQFPNRRDPKTGLSAAYSDTPVFAGNTDCNNPNILQRVSPTFEAYEQGSEAKTDLVTELNVINPNSTYNTWHPTSPDDGNVSGYNIPPVTGRYINNAFEAGTPIPNTGHAFNPRVHSLGGMIHGINNIPKWVKAISVVRTEPANRVIAQGIGTYKVYPNPVNPVLLPANKSTVSLNFYSKDIQYGLVPQNIIEDIQQNPENYGLQFVSPLGFYSEIYGYYPAPPLPLLSSGTRAVAADMLSYACIQRESNVFNINAGDGSNTDMGYGTTSGPPGRYVSYATWRNPGSGVSANINANTALGQSYSYWNDNGNNGNAIVGIAQLNPVTTGRGEYWDLVCVNYVYTPQGQATYDQTAFNNESVKGFHQPWYVINIVRKGAAVDNLRSPQYINTGMTIKMESCIGVMPAAVTTPSISFDLVNERIDDVRGYLQTDYEYVYVRGVNEPERAWLCISNNAAIPPIVGTILSDIQTNGFWLAPDGTEVYGLYTVQFPQSLSNITTSIGRGQVTFGQYGTTALPMPPAGSRIIVKFNRKNVRFFGGDVTVAPSIHAVLDGEFSAQHPAPSTMPIGGLPLPHPGFVRNANYHLPLGTGSINNMLSVNGITTLRQWCIMFDCESRAPGWFDTVGPQTESAYPRVHYVMRPYSWLSGIYADFHPSYFIDYPEEYPWLAYGGIRFQNQANLDYAKQPLVTALGVPESGFIERTQYPTGIIASEEFDPTQQDSPGLRTFLDSNLIVLSEENGEIKTIASALGGGGRNMYAWTNRGVCRVLTSKNVLTGASGEMVATQSISNYWGEEMWITRNIGIPDQMWRLFVKGYAPTGQGYADSFFWADRRGLYRMTGDNIVDISRDRYLSVMLPMLSAFPSDYTGRANGFYNLKYNEAWFSIDLTDIPNAPRTGKKVYVYSPLNQEWVGKYTYDFDGYSANNSDTYGFRLGGVYKLDGGYEINSATRRASVVMPIVGDIGKLKQFNRWAVVGTKPDEIRIYNKDGVLWVIQNEALAEALAPGQGQDWVLRYDSWQQWAWCVMQSVDPQQRNPQDEFFYLEVIYNTEGDKEVLTLEAQLQPIR